MLDLAIRVFVIFGGLAFVGIAVGLVLLAFGLGTMEQADKAINEDRGIR